MARDFSKDFYNSNAWRKQRLYILKRDNYTCTEAGCHSLATEVHHMIELNESNIDDINICLNENNLRSLCHNCHTKITKASKGSSKLNCLPTIRFDSNGFCYEVFDSESIK